MDIDVIAWNEKLDGAPLGVLLYFMCFGVGFVIKRTKWFSNSIIPIAIMVFAIGIFMAGSPPRDPKVALRIWLTRNFLLGGIIGFMAWMTHQYGWKKLQDKYGWFQAEDDTVFVNRNESQLSRPAIGLDQPKDLPKT